MAIPRRRPAAASDGSVTANVSPRVVTGCLASPSVVSLGPERDCQTRESSSGFTDAERKASPNYGIGWEERQESRAAAVLS